MKRSDELEEYLSLHGIKWSEVPLSRHRELENQWMRVYGDVWKMGMRNSREARAEAEYRKRSAAVFLIVPFLGDWAGPHGLGKIERSIAYECRGAGPLPRLLEFNSLDFFVSPPDLSWTIVHTHEDYSLGGPYFVDREWLTPPIRRRRF